MASPAGQYSAVTGQSTCTHPAAASLASTRQRPVCRRAQRAVWASSPTPPHQRVPHAIGTYGNACSGLPCWTFPRRNRPVDVHTQQLRRGAVLASASLCAVGQFANATASSACAVCVPGRYSLASGQSSCTVCPAGQSSSAGSSTVCTPCEAEPVRVRAHRAPQAPSPTAPVRRRAAAVLRGSTPPLHQLHLVHRWSVQRCNRPAGMHGQQLRHWAVLARWCCSMRVMPPSVTANAIACTVCAGGSWSPAAGATACTLCTPGQYSLSGSPCSPCGVGQYSDTSGATSCTLCGSGSSNTASAATCTACPSVPGSSTALSASGHLASSD